MLDVARSLAAIHEAVTAGTEVSRTWETPARPPRPRSTTACPSAP
ncbi:hypothetical protein [Streptomyces sp. NBC_01591]|nr:hypothetical protein [Streptomyces sp. NBC_01591]